MKTNNYAIETIKSKNNFIFYKKKNILYINKIRILTNQIILICNQIWKGIITIIKIPYSILLSFYFHFLP